MHGLMGTHRFAPKRGNTVIYCSVCEFIPTWPSHIFPILSQLLLFFIPSPIIKPQSPDFVFMLLGCLFISYVLDSTLGLSMSYPPSIYSVKLVVRPQLVLCLSLQPNIFFHSWSPHPLLSSHPLDYWLLSTLELKDFISSFSKGTIYKLKLHPSCLPVSPTLDSHLPLQTSLYLQNLLSNSGSKKLTYMGIEDSTILPLLPKNFHNPVDLGSNLLNRKDGQTRDWTQDPPDIYQML